MVLSQGGRVAWAGAGMVGVAFGVVRYIYGVTLPELQQSLEVSELVLGLVASGTFAGFLVALLLTGPVAGRFGPRAPTTVGGVCGVTGCLLVATAPGPAVLALGAVLAGSAGGWVWAPYSDLVSRTAPEPQRPRLLAIVTTGTSGGLMALGLLALVSTLGSWRAAWAVAALLAAVAAVVNLAWVPRLRPGETGAAGEAGQGPAAGADGSGWRALLRALSLPLAYSVVYFAVCIVYFTYAADALESGPTAGIPLLYLLIGATGTVAVRTGRFAARWGSSRVAAGCLLVVGAALVVLAGADQRLAVVAASATLFGAAYMTGSALLAVWTAEVAPRTASQAFTVTLVAGAVSSVAAPAAVGAALPAVGLRAVLLATAVVAALGGAAVAAAPGARRVVAAGRSRP